MSDKKINCLSLFSMIVSLCISSFYGITSSYLLNMSKTSILISMLLGYILSLLFSLVVYNFFKYKENYSFVNKIKFIYKKFSIVINTLIIISSIIMYITFTNRLTSFLSTQYLVQTKKIFILIPILFITYHTANKGIETISRVSTISFFISIAIYIFDIFGLLNHINFENYLPLITVNNNTIFKASLLFCTFFTTPIAFINVTNKGNLDDKSKFKKYFFLGHFVSFLIVFGAISVTLGVYGINLCNEFDYPLYTVLKKISLFNFIDAVENASIMFWIISSINTSTIILYFIFNNIKETYNINNSLFKYLIMIISIIIPFLLFDKTIYLESYSSILIPTIAMIFPTLICLISLIIKREH